MEILLNKILKFNFNISDFAIDPLNNNIIMTGDSLVIYNNDRIIKSIKSKLKNSINLRFIKYSNQLFQSSDFYISTNNKIIKFDGIKKKIIKEIDLNVKNIVAITISSSEKVVYISNNTLYILNISNDNIKSYSLRDLGDGIFKLYISGENVLIKHRALYKSESSLLIFNLDSLDKLMDIKSNSNHIYSKIIGLNYFASTYEGELELWDILDSEINTSYKLSNSKITYFDNFDNMYYLGNINGELIITDEEFNIVNKIKIFQKEIKKIIKFNNNIYILSIDNKIAIYKILENNDLEDEINKFIEYYSIDNTYKEFFNYDRVIKINNFIKALENDRINITPKKENIFKALWQNLNNIKVCIIGKDPYFQENVATGLAFEVKSNSWSDEKINTSLKNILKLIYKSYNNELIDINKIRNKINSGEFKILPPNKIFESWEKQGVLLLNSSLTTEISIAGAHHKFWKEIIDDLIKYISSKNPNIIYLLWGNDAAVLEKNILNGDIIKHNHPAICGNLNNENDFLLGTSFEYTKNIINWIGEI